MGRVCALLSVSRYYSARQLVPLITPHNTILHNTCITMISSRTCSILALLAICSVLVNADRSFSGPDIPPGPYCGSRRASCCVGRQDGCSVPILGTLCYCDNFCNRTKNDDCCPDYFSFCLGETEPENIISCYHNNRNLQKGDRVTDNCNDCVCTEINGIPEMICDADPCMVDEKLINDINLNGRSSWIAQKYDKFWGRKLSDGITLRTGTINPRDRFKGMNPTRPVYDPNSLPRSFNAMDQWRGQLSHIVDQGWCGASWAISTAAVASDKFAILSNGYETPTLSAQQLVSCNNKGQICNGGYLDRAWQYTRKVGLVNEECFPYVGGNQRCTFQRKGTLASSNCILPEHHQRKNRYHVGPAYRLGNETDIMYEIMYSGPVQSTMKVYQDFFSYSDGVYKHSNLESAKDFGHHSVRLVGWGVQNNIKYWLAANSWGEDWGENGFFKILRGQNECEIEEYVIGAWASTFNENDNRVPINNK